MIEALPWLFGGVAFALLIFIIVFPTSYFVFDWVDRKFNK